MYIQNDGPIEKTIWIPFSQKALNNNQDFSNQLVKSFTTNVNRRTCVQDNVRIDNSPPLEPQAQEWELNLEPGFPWATGAMDRGTARLHFSGVKPLQADAENDGLFSDTNQVKEIIALSEAPIMTPNGGTKATTISFMSLKSTPATNQEPTQGKGTSLQPGPMTTTLEQDNQVAKLGASTNERTPRPSVILLPLDPIPPTLPFPIP
ncbi:hypothetical protein DSO57_1011559 [Entomophthora muscae]|uniref:Uncharacterized protein n=1 Tax=Entomophthora muscae TaxID=34485 RepID=A0ACC2SV98_9FUNG|nr:hypothetical protein DSO57_1011559 [Entomophthora muscae]